MAILTGLVLNKVRAILGSVAPEDLSKEEMVARLLELEQQNTDMPATTEFDELWGLLEEELKTATKKKRKHLLRQLLEALPVALVDKASRFPYVIR